jgi:hypothetical protein
MQFYRVIATWLPALLCAALQGLPAGALAHSTPPQVNVKNPQVAECISPSVSVWLNAKVQSDWDPLPTQSIKNRISGDAAGFPTNSDPDQYPFGSRTVSITGCDHNTPTINCTTVQVSLKVLDTLRPNINPGRNAKFECTSPQGLPTYISSKNTPYCADTCDTQCPACTNPATASQTSCTSCQGPCMTACSSNKAYAALDRPSASDICDPSASWYLVAPAPANFPIGATSLQVNGSDFSGNQAQAKVTVQVVDTTAPVFVGTVPNFNVVSQALTSGPLSCTTGAQSGTLVTLPHPVATDLCTQPSAVVYQYKLCGGTGCAAATANLSNVVCMPDGANTVQFVAIDGVGNISNSNVTTTVNVRPQAGFAINANLTLTSWGYTTSAGGGTLSALASNYTGTLSWNFVGARTPDTQTPLGAAGIQARFLSEGNFCPTYVSVFDSSGNAGATPNACFAIDNTVPQHTFGVIPPPSAWPGGNTPIFSHGAPMPLVVHAMDAAGSVRSGISQVTATLVSPVTGSTVVYDNSYCSNVVGSPVLPTCPLVHDVGGCNKLLTPLCLCPATGPDGECTGDGRLDLSQLTNGSYTLQLTVRDLAGNAETQTYPFNVGDLPGSLTGTATNPNSGLATMLTTVMQDPNTPPGAVFNLYNAIAYVNSASKVFLESPGQSFVLSRQAWTQIDQALSNGANVSFHENFLASSVAGEARRILVAVRAKVADPAYDFSSWSILKDPNGIPTPRYLTRRWLTHRGNVFRDYMVNPNSTLRLAASLLAISDQHTTRGETAAAMDSATALYDALSPLFIDNTLADLYGYAGYTVHNVNVGTVANPNYVAEGYFRKSPASHFGYETAAVVNAQIGRFVALAQNGNLYGIPASTVATLQTVQAQMATFTQNVAQVQQKNWNPQAASFSNMQLTRNVYLNAVGALQNLAQLQGATVYTRYWQTGLAFTLADVMNFSLYEGPTALTCILYGADSTGIPNDNSYNGCSAASHVPGVPVIFNSYGQSKPGNTVDWEAVTAECRYNKLMYALADGRRRGPLRAEPVPYR